MKKTEVYVFYGILDIYWCMNLSSNRFFILKTSLGSTINAFNGMGKLQWESTVSNCLRYGRMADSEPCQTSQTEHFGK